MPLALRFLFINDDGTDRLAYYVTDKIVCMPNALLVASLAYVISDNHEKKRSGNLPDLFIK